MAVSRDRSQRFPVRFQQHAVEVIADVLLRHREMRLVEQPLERGLRDGQCLLRTDVLDRREVAAGSVASVKRLLPERTVARSPSIETVTCAFSGNARTMSSSLRPGTVTSPACCSVTFGLRDQLDFEIRRRDRELLASADDQHVRQDRHRLPPLHHADDRLQAARGSFPALR